MIFCSGVTSGVIRFLGVKEKSLIFSDLIILNVDLEGVEPSSKRGSHMLSTCLSLPLVFEYRQDQSHQPVP